MPANVRVPFPTRVGKRLTVLVIVIVVVVLGGAGGPGGVDAARAAPARPDDPSPVPVGSPAPTGAPSDGRFRWPLAPRPPVVRRFAPPPRPWLPGHRGVDLSADAGSAVHTAGPGVVRFAGRLAGRGVVSVEHAGGLRTTYEPVTPAVTVGQRLRAGDVVGILDAGHPGCPADSCLHWGLRRGEIYLDPLALVGAARVRLLPLDPPSPAPVTRRSGGPAARDYP